MRAPGHYAPGVEVVSPEPTSMVERAKNPNHFLPVRVSSTKAPIGIQATKVADFPV